MFCLACHAKHGVKIFQYHARAKKIEPANIVILRNIFFIFSSETRPGNIYFFKVSNKSTTKWFEICSSLTIKTPAWRHWRCFDVFTVNLEHISQLSSRVYIVGFDKFKITNALTIAIPQPETFLFLFFALNTCLAWLRWILFKCNDLNPRDLVHIPDMC